MGYYINPTNGGDSMSIQAKLAGAFARSTGLDYDDLLQEACLAYLRAERNQNYDHRQSAFDTFAYTCMRNALATYVSKQRRHPAHEEIPETIEAPEPTSEQRVAFYEEVDSLQEEAKFVIHEILQSPIEYLGGGARHGRSLLRTLLRRLDWSPEQINGAFDQIRWLLARHPSNPLKRTIPPRMEG